MTSRKHNQSRSDSLMEALTNTAIGFIISMSAWVIVSPVTGVYISMKQNLEVTAVFTVVSIARQYVLRRMFDGRSPWQAIKSLFVRPAAEKPSCFGDFPRQNYQVRAERDCWSCLTIGTCLQATQNLPKGHYGKLSNPVAWRHEDKVCTVCKADCGQCGGPI